MSNPMCEHGVVKCPSLPMVTCCRIGDIEWHKERIAWHRSEIERLEGFQLLVVRPGPSAEPNGAWMTPDTVKSEYWV